jgi:PHD/YefM family antitoxin component YafN of YafNO toxin-antitoxin module
MLKIKKEYIVNSNNKKKAVLIDIETFEKLEELLENYGLGKYMEEVKDEEELSINEAKEYYDILKKN